MRRAKALTADLGLKIAKALATLRRHTAYGEMAERSKAAVLKTVREPVFLGGSNPSLSARTCMI